MIVGGLSCWVSSMANHISSQAVALQAPPEPRGAKGQGKGADRRGLLPLATIQSPLKTECLPDALCLLCTPVSLSDLTT
jgi:hypothetical protein